MASRGPSAGASRAIGGWILAILFIASEAPCLAAAASCPGYLSKLVATGKKVEATIEKAQAVATAGLYALDGIGRRAGAAVSGADALTYDYLREVARTRGLRLILRKVDQASLEHPRFLGLFTPHEPRDFSWWTDFLTGPLFYPTRRLTKAILGRGWDFSPFDALQYQLMTRPVRRLTRKSAEGPRDLTLPFYLAANAGKWVVIGLLMDQAQRYFTGPGIDDKKKKKRETEWDTLIETDARFWDIKLLLKRKVISPEQARVLARARQMKGNREWLLQQPFFAEARILIERGLENHPAFLRLPNFRKHLDDRQKDELIQIQAGLYASAQLIPRLLEKEDLPGELTGDPVIASLWHDMQADPFTQYLLQRHRDGKLEDGALARWLIKDMTWRARFSQWKVLGVQKRKKKAGRYLDVPLQIEDIEQELREDIEAGKSP